ncbi:SMI1/KNR4 family protein [Anaerobacillus sp. CMMVII]|uniref:SMI1/KNR4 family protein n=1 Tax=Anaerobacillus sp. CMMVII TaxID=2755588 RepID=UPI0021B80900|nr:SMI1/KNR4 family protein [Anaerobacillus sp. CMMVII]
MAKSLWQTDINEYKLEQLTDEIIKKAEEVLKVKLPEAYLSILKEQNGGYLLYNAHPSPLPTVWGETFVTVEYISGIGVGNGILENDYLIKEWGMPEGLIFFSGEGHTWLAFDYRQVTSDPSIVYVDNDTEQIITIAANFREFLDQLYVEDFEGSGMEIEEYSKEDFELLLQQDNIEGLMNALLLLSQRDVDMNWFSEQLVKLSTHREASLRAEVANHVSNFLTYRIADPTLEKLVENFKNDDDPDVRLYAELIEEKMNYSFDQLKQDLNSGEMISFSYQESIYHLNEHSHQWHLSDYQGDLQSFHSTDELLEQARIAGKLLKDLWVNVKKV